MSKQVNHQKAADWDLTTGLSKGTEALLGQHPQYTERKVSENTQNAKLYY